LRFCQKQNPHTTKALWAKSYSMKLYIFVCVCVCVCVCVRICTIDVQEPSFSDMLICDSCQHLKTCWKMGAFQLEGIW
jgi:hypothetical protein